MNLDYIIEFIEILKEELKKSKDLDDISKIEYAYNELAKTFIEKIKTNKDFDIENKCLILEIFSSLDVTFKNAVILEVIKVNLKNKNI
jgi:hypothetical protein